MNMYSADLEIARKAAAELSELQGYPQLARPYLAGEWDGDNEVQSALIALRLARQADCIIIPREAQLSNKRCAQFNGD
jgi:hypothetical protein